MASVASTASKPRGHVTSRKPLRSLEVITDLKGALESFFLTIQTWTYKILQLLQSYKSCKLLQVVHCSRRHPNVLFPRDRSRALELKGTRVVYRVFLAIGYVAA